MIAISTTLSGCDFIAGSESHKLSLIEENFYKLELISEYALNGDVDVISSDRKDHGLLGYSQYRHNVLQKAIHDSGIKFLKIERSSGTIELNYMDAGVYGDAYLSLVYSKNPKKSTILTTPEAWQCKKYEKEGWHICREPEEE
ncbi:hypothetical protein QSV34_12965 [Porticoccus sp. W117]|uniref:hypothetical protein n=1 Tax=Porticoccus sp. W117 TaxID=3054777 RepID=UPI00259990B8|nr:hypothetical protein [Porticoccus sp. W117]MDM3872259.1 hypothetical protein [Porticoccus sp. W117]